MARRRPLFEFTGWQPVAVLPYIFSYALALYFHEVPLLAFVPQRRKDTRFQNFLFGSDPVFQISSFDLSALIVKLLCAQPYFSLQQFHHQFLSFASSSYAVHCIHPTIYLSTNIVNGELLQGREEGGY